MNKDISELNIPEESKILISKIEKRITFLSSKAQEHFDKSISIAENKIKDAYSNNEDLISILKQNDELAKEIRDAASSIRKGYQTNFTKEQILDVTKEVDDIKIITNTVDYKDNLIKSADKINLLHKRKKYLNNRNARRKVEYESELERIEEQINKEATLNIKPMSDDIDLIKKFIDKKKIKNGKFWYLINFLILIVIIVIVIGIIIWV